MKKIDFLIYYEFWQRELLGILLLKAELEKRGYSVRLSEFCVDKKLDYIKLFYQPEVVIYPWVYSNIDIKRVTYFYNRVYKIVNLESEQILSPRALRNGFFLPKEEAKKVYHVCWGKNMYDLLKKEGISENRLLLTGSLSLDINLPKFQPLFLSKVEVAKKYNLDINKKWIMFFSNFKFPSMSQEKLKELEIRSPGVLELNKLMVKEKYSIISYFSRFLQDNVEYLIIYRPHPVEPFSKELADLEQQFDNFKYITDLTIQQWIKVCDKLLTWNSTSIVDAHFSGKPYALVRTKTIPEFYDSYLFHDCATISSYQQFENFLLNDNYRLSCINENAYKKHIINNGKEMVYEKLADYLEKIYKSDDKLEVSWNRPKPLTMNLRLLYIFLMISEYVYLNPFYFNKQYYNTLKMHYENKIRERKFYKKIKQIFKRENNYGI